MVRAASRARGAPADRPPLPQAPKEQFRNNFWGGGFDIVLSRMADGQGAFGAWRGLDGG